MMEHQQNTDPSVGKPRDDVQPPERPSALEWDHRPRGAPAEEVVLVVERLVGRSQDDMLGDIKVRGIYPCRCTFAEAGGPQGTQEHRRSGQPDFNE
jgi:hypothetical protein